MNQPLIWPVSNIVIFDCDSTLTVVEGIDELARLAGNEKDIAISIAALTKRAMEGDLPLEAVYGQRLVTVNPTLAQIRQIASIYRENVIPDARAVIAALQSAGVQVFIVSGGLVEPVREFGAWLGVPRDNIHAVDLEYNQLSGAWWRYWEQRDGLNPTASHLAVGNSPLVSTRGKNRIIAGIRRGSPGRALLIGDGLSDLEASSEVDLFVGFGGAVYRQRVAGDAPVYLHTRALSPLIPLALGQVHSQSHNSEVWADGLRRIQAGEVTFGDPGLKSAFEAAVQHSTNRKDNLPGPRQAGG